jgi:AcrR family transcriptional regulator
VQQCRRSSAGRIDEAEATDVAERRSAQQRAPLTRAQVVTEALAAIDADGVDALTMRKLADRLGVYPTAVYWHAGNKAALLAAVCEHVLAGLELPPVHDGTDWQEWIRAMARAARATLHAPTSFP